MMTNWCFNDEGWKTINPYYQFFNKTNDAITNAWNRYVSIAIKTPRRNLM